MGSSSRPKILLLGDSLTQLSWGKNGWGAQLADVYQRRADVINRGMAGYNTEWFSEYALEDDVFRHVNVQLITIFFGANDASDATLNPHHHVPVDQYKMNLKMLIQLCREHYGREIPILLLTPPPVVHEQRLVYQKERYGDKATGILERNMTLSGDYANASAVVADDCHVPCIHLWKAMQEDPKWERFFYDGLHFSEEGNTFVATSLLNAIAKEYPHLAVTPCPLTKQWANSASKCSGLQSSGPYHDQIDHHDSSIAFEQHYEAIEEQTPKKQKR